MSPNTIRQAAAEYIIVGSGAGGGTVAARLAEAGRTVLLLEAGGDPRRFQVYFKAKRPYALRHKAVPLVRENRS